MAETVENGLQCQNVDNNRNNWLIDWLVFLGLLINNHQPDNGQNHGFIYFHEDTGPESRCLNPNCELKMLSFSFHRRQDKSLSELKLLKASCGGSGYLG